MSEEPPRMTLDLSPYFRLLTRRPNPQDMSEAEIEKRLKKVERFTNDTSPYAMTLAVGLIFGLAAASCGLMALGVAAPGLWAIGGAYVLHKVAVKPLLKAVALRSHGDALCYTTELAGRASMRAVAEQQEAQQRVKRAREAFEKALNEGLPLQSRISIKKSPLKLKANIKAPGTPGASSGSAGG